MKVTRRDGFYFVEDSQQDRAVCCCVHEEHARRIAACLNAAQGLSLEELQQLARQTGGSRTNRQAG